MVDKRTSRERALETLQAAKAQNAAAAPEDIKAACAQWV